MSVSGITREKSLGKRACERTIVGHPKNGCAVVA